MGRDSSVETAKEVSAIMERRVFCWMRIITMGSRHLLFECGETQLICRRLEGEFLDYHAAIPRANPISITVSTKSLISSIDRVSVVISESGY